MQEKISSEMWGKVAKTVGEAEKEARKGARASRDLYEKTGNPKSERAKGELNNQRSSKLVLAKTREQEAATNTEKETLLGETGSLERALVGLQRKNLVEALRTEKNLKKDRTTLLAEETEVLEESKDTLSSSELDALEDIRMSLQINEQERNELLQKNPESYFGLHLKELKEYKDEIEHGRIVETPYVKKHIADIVAHLRANKPVLVYGHFGSGKTELAMHVARKYMEKEALIISGAKNMSLAELYGHQVLALDKVNTNELDSFAREVEEKFKIWETAHQEASEAEKNRAHDRILQTYLTRLKGGTISEFFLGPIYQAMQEGHPIIIDEVNAIPHEVLVSLNHILTRKPCDNINVQQDSGKMIKVKKGFCIMMTGNLNQGQEQYIGRQDMDPAFLSRLYKLEYDYLPQNTEGTLDEATGSENELFHLLLTRVMDKNGNVVLPEGSVKKLWNLAKAARVTQDVFAGRRINNAFYLKEAGGRSVPYMLKEAALTLRALDGVINQWKVEGYKFELDQYVYKEFVAPSTQASDRAYLYQLLKDQFNFFQGDGWEQNPNYGSGGVVRSFSIKAPENKAGSRHFYGPRDVVMFAYGQPPERAEWPEIKSQDNDETSTLEADETSTLEDVKMIEKMRALETFKQAAEDEITKLVRI